MKNIKLHLLTVLLIIASILIIPDLSTDLSEYQRVNTVLASTNIEEQESGGFRRKRTRRTLFMEMKDGSVYRVPNDYRKYWNEIQNPANINKPVLMYISNTSDVPVQLEIENAVIYEVNESLPIKYFILLLALGMAIYSGKRLNNYISTNNKQQYNKDYH